MHESSVAGGGLAARLAPGRSDGAADGFRVGLNLQQDGVLDVGMPVIGAQRIADGTAFYGRFPEREGSGRAVNRPRTARLRTGFKRTGVARWRLLGDTYGPVNYHAYLPGLAVLGWSGESDRLPAVRFTTLLFDLLALLGLAAVGLASAERGWRWRSWRSLGRQTRSRSTCRAPTRTTRSCPRF